MLGYKSYRDYLLIKTHFNNPDFTWHKNFAYTRNLEETFQKRKDRRMFEVLESKISNREELIEVMISAFLFSDGSFWIRRFAGF